MLLLLRVAAHARPGLGRGRGQLGINAAVANRPFHACPVGSFALCGKDFSSYIARTPTSLGRELSGGNSDNM